MSGLDNELMEILAQLSGMPIASIEPQMPLFGSGLNLDSVLGLNLMAELESRFGITLEDLDIALDAFDNVRALSELVSTRKQEPINIPIVRPNTEPSDLLYKVAQDARLKEGANGVEKVLTAICKEPGLTSRDLASRCSLPTPTVAALRKELVKAGLLEDSGKGAVLSSKGTDLIKGMVIDFNPWDMLAELTEALIPLLGRRPTADTSVDQAKCTPETCARRALLALEHGTVADKSIAFIGDDDFTSIGLGVLGRLLEARKIRGPKKLTVLDIDPRIIKMINDMAEELSLPIIALYHDMRDPIPECVYKCHDAFFTDPPYTVDGARLFISRGVELCRKAGFYLYFSFAPKGPAEMLQVYRAMVSMGLLPRQILPGFNNYEGASLWGNKSQMIVLEGVEGASSALEGSYEGDLYTADFRGK